MSFVFSLDFGSAYTKVALRYDPDKPSEMVSDKALSLDLLNICIPSVVAADQNGGATRWLCGPQAVRLVGGNGLTVYRNWKPQLFTADHAEMSDASTEQALEPEATAITATGAGSPVAVLSRSAGGKVEHALGALARLSVERQQLIVEVARLQRLSVKEVTAVVDAEELTVVDLRDLLARLRRTPSVHAEAAAPGGSTGVDQVAREFFRWMRGFLERPCQKFGITDIGRVPVRVCVPAFVQPMSSVGSSSARERLLAILREAGWEPDEHYPTVTEPFANGIGILTQGKNKTWANTHNHIRDLHMPSMFGDSPFMTAIREGSGDYVVLVVDVGSFTSDFAVLEFNAKDYEDRPRVLDHSEALGVEILDREVQAVLPPEKAARLEAIDLKNRETFKEIVYGQMKACMLGKGGMKVGESEEGQRIRERIRTFAGRIAHRLDSFLDENGVSELHEIVLTGGGNQIPLIRSTLRERLCGRSGTSPVVLHLPLPSSEPADSGTHRLDHRLVRGGSALGAVSVYIDYMV